MQWKNAFDALVVDDPPDCEGCVDASAFTCDDRAGEYLRADFIAFLYPAVDIDDIAHLEMGDFVLQTLAFNRV